jgi:CRP/FNR family transcriptional regulator, cyclic AMP receptor protein
VGNSKPGFNTGLFADAAGGGGRIVEYQRGEVVFAAGDPGEHLLYIQQGGIKLSARSATGREAVIAVLGPGDLFGEGCLAGHRLRIDRATAITSTTIRTLKKRAVAALLRRERGMSDGFLRYMLTRNIRSEEDLLGQIFTSSEKRLAGVLLELARYGTQEIPHRTLSKISPQELARTAGTTTVRVQLLLKKFKKKGFVDYNGHITVNSSLLTVVLHD